MEVKHNIFPSLLYFASWHFCGSLYDVTKVRDLETQRLLLLSHPENTKYQSAVSALTWAVVKDENVIVVTACILGSRD